MYSFEEKEAVIKRIKDGESTVQISESTGISKTTISKWKKEIELRRKIINLIEKGEIQEARKELEELKGKNVQAIRLALQAKIERKEGNREELKRLLQEILKLEPDNVKARSSLAKIAREEGNREELKRLLQEILKLEPDNLIAMSSLVRIAREEGNEEEAKRLLQEILRIDPDNVKARSSLARIAREEGNEEEAKRLLQEILRIDPDNVKARSGLVRIARKERNREEEKRLLQEILRLEPDNAKAMERLKQIGKENELKEQQLGKERVKLEEQMIEAAEEKDEETMTNIEKARRIIYQSERIEQDAEKIRELLEGEDETERQIVIAEMYYHTGLVERAEKSLKGYKRSLNKETQRSEIKAVNKGIELIKDPKTKIFDFKWNEYWQEIQETKEQVANNAPISQGDDNEAR